jgi:hypothetical protein
MKATVAYPTFSIKALVLLWLMQLSCESLDVVGLSTSMFYKLMEDAVVPTSGVTTVGTIFSRSVIRCAAECNVSVHSALLSSFAKIYPVNEMHQVAWGIVNYCHIWTRMVLSWGRRTTVDNST